MRKSHQIEAFTRLFLTLWECLVFEYCHTPPKRTTLSSNDLRIKHSRIYEFYILSGEKIRVLNIRIVARKGAIMS